MNPQAPTSEHVFLPLIARAQLIACGLVLTIGAVAAGASAIDLDAVRSLLGA